MIYQALKVVLDAHRDSRDKGGDPVLSHLLRVAATVNESFEGGEVMTVIALLHDLREDTDFPPSMIASLFGEEVATCVDILTRKNNEDYFMDYLPRVIANEKCRQVKIADNLDNSLDFRLAKLEDRDADRLRRKYEKAWTMLVRPPHQLPPLEQSGEL